MKNHPKFLIIFLFCFFLCGLLAARISPFSSNLSQKVSPPLGPLSVNEMMLWHYQLPASKMSALDWDQLPKIGPQLAERLANFCFGKIRCSNLDALSQVKGVGPKIQEHLASILKTSLPKF